MGKKLVAARELARRARARRGRPRRRSRPPTRAPAVRARRARSAARSPGRWRRRRRSSRARRRRRGLTAARALRRRRGRDAVTRPSDDELRAIGLVVFDFDGVFTDNRVWVNEAGEESVACWRGDGIGLRRLDEVGVPYVIVSTEPNPVVARRAEEARSAVHPRRRRQARRAPRRGGRSGCRARARSPMSGTTSTTPPAWSAVGLPIVPADAWPEVVPLARWVLERPGGRRLRSRALRRRLARPPGAAGTRPLGSAA